MENKLNELEMNFIIIACEFSRLIVDFEDTTNKEFKEMTGVTKAKYEKTIEDLKYKILELKDESSKTN